MMVSSTLLHSFDPVFNFDQFCRVNIKLEGTLEDRIGDYDCVLNPDIVKDACGAGQRGDSAEVIRDLEDIEDDF